MAESTLDVQRILERALARSPQSRFAHLEQACGGNLPLLNEARSLLPYLEKIGDVSGQPLNSWGRAFFGVDSLASTTILGGGSRSRSEETEVPLFIDGYKITGLIGVGGMGMVYRGEHRTLHHEFAVKVPRQRMLCTTGFRRLSLEIEIHRHLQRPGDPGIARFIHHGSGEVVISGKVRSAKDIRPYFVMEHIAGTRLIDYVQKTGLGAPGRVRLLIKLFKAVKYMHDRGIAHLDLKPQNILVDSGGQPHILDFGAAMPFESAGSATGELDSCRVGTPKYASPEQSGERGTIGAASDVFTLGLIAVEVLHGSSLPITLSRANADELCRMAHDAFGAREADAVLGHQLAQVIRRALIRHPSTRLPSAGKLCDEFSEFLDQHARSEGTAVEPRTPATAADAAPSDTLFRLLQTRVMQRAAQLFRAMI